MCGVPWWRSLSVYVEGYSSCYDRIYTQVFCFLVFLKMSLSTCILSPSQRSREVTFAK